MWTVEISVMLGMIAVNSIFAAYEIALATVSAGSLRRLAQEGRPGARVALHMKGNMEASLAIVQLGITLVGAVAAATGGAGAEERIVPWMQARTNLSEGWAEAISIAAVVLPLTIVTITFGELVPKVFALRHSEWVCLKLSRPMRVLLLAVWPAVRMFELAVAAVMNWGERLWSPRKDSRPSEDNSELQELHASAALARASRLIGAREEGIILGAARMSRMPLREVMLPAADISLLHSGETIGECLARAHLEMHTRFPVTDRPGDPQAIIGYVNFKDIVAHMRLSPGDPSLRGIVRQIPGFHERDTISSALETLMRERTHIALVRDEGGRVTGFITLEDIIEELVGDIQDEYDQLPSHVAALGSGWIAGGGTTLERLKETTGLDLTQDGSRHLAAWLEARLGRPVQSGDVVVRNGVRVSVRKVRRQRLIEAQVGESKDGRDR